MNSIACNRFVFLWFRKLLPRSEYWEDLYIMTPYVFASSPWRKKDSWTKEGEAVVGRRQRLPFMTDRVIFSTVGNFDQSPRCDTKGTSRGWRDSILFYTEVFYAAVHTHFNDPYKLVLQKYWCLSAPASVANRHIDGTAYFGDATLMAYAGEVYCHA